MSSAMLLHIGLFMMGVMISAFSQVLLKKSALKEYASPLQEYLNPYVITGYFLFFGATFCNLLGYRMIPLSFGPILEASGYIFVTILGAIFFSERISARKILGLGVIMIGILVYVLPG